MKFKVGDKVKVLKEGSHGQEIGTICEITKIDKGNTDIPYLAKCPRGIEMWFYEDQLEKMQFTKSDLKDGDIVTYRTGRKRVVQGEKLLQLDGNNGYNLNGYRDDLTEKNNDKDLDIIKVERPVQYETVYERKEEILDEAEKRYLKGVIRPFRNKIKSICRKEKCYNKNISYICIELEDNDAYLPDFKTNTMYKNMKSNKEYTLEELRTIKE